LRLFAGLKRRCILKRISFVFFLLVLSLAGAVRASTVIDDRAPGWLSAAANLPTPSFEIKDVPAVVLRNEETVRLTSDGTVVRTIRVAVRILTKAGRDEAFAQAVYTTDSDKVKSLDAWLIRRAGPVISYGKKETIDIAL